MELTVFDMVMRLATAAVIGAVLGLDREIRNKPAGMRTHALVALGASLLMVTAIYMSRLSPTAADAISRVMQGIVAGVGFLGAGAILKEEHGQDVHGLTTAASVWLVASVGVACGGGYWYAAAATVIIALIVLIFGESVEVK